MQYKLNSGAIAKKIKNAHQPCVISAIHRKRGKARRDYNVPMAIRRRLNWCLLTHIFNIPHLDSRQRLLGICILVCETIWSTSGRVYMQMQFIRDRITLATSNCKFTGIFLALFSWWTCN